MQTKVYCKHFYSVSKETSHKPLKVAAAKKKLPNVCTIDTTCFDECSLFHVITGRHYLLYSFIYQRLYNRRELRSKNFYFLNVLNKIYLLIVFFTLSVCECFTFLFINELL